MATMVAEMERTATQDNPYRRGSLGQIGAWLRTHAVIFTRTLSYLPSLHAQCVHHCGCTGPWFVFPHSHPHLQPAVDAYVPPEPSEKKPIYTSEGLAQRMQRLKMFFATTFR